MKKRLMAMSLVSSLLAYAGQELGVGVSRLRLELDGKMDEYAYVGYDWSAPFIVFDRENAVTNGLFEPVGKPYSDLKTQSGVFSDGTNLCVTFLAPCSGVHCPPGSKDRVGIAVSPDGRDILVVECDMSGNCGVMRIGTDGTRTPLRDAGVRAGVHVREDKAMFGSEIAIPFSAIGKVPKSSGDDWLFNAYRRGPSCGGVSSWSPVQGDMFDLSRFGRIVFGARKSGNAAPLPENKGKNVFLWSGERWGGGMSAKPPLDEKELRKVDLSGPRGGRAVAHFRVSNMTDRPALYSLKTDDFQKNEFARRVRFREVGDVELKGGPTVPDPIFDLPNGSVLRIAARSTAMVWVDMDLDGFRSGVHKATLRLVPGYSRFEEKTLALELKVGKADIREIDMPCWAYPLRSPRDFRSLKDYRFNVSCIVMPWFSPAANARGERNWRMFDDVIASMLENGTRMEEIRLLVYTMFPMWGNPRGKPEQERKLIDAMRVGIAYAKSRYGIGLDRIWFSTRDEPYGDPDDPKTGASFAFYGAQLAKRINPGLKSWTNPYKADEVEYLPRYLKEFDVLTPFLPVVNRYDQLASEKYAKSGKEIWSYTIYLKQNRPVQYRGISWKNFEYGFEGPATFYDLFDMSGDGFNSYDAKGGADYGALYRDRRTGGAIVSLRLEAWYQGHLEQRLLKWCRNRISGMKDTRKAAKFKARLDALVKRATSPRSDFDAISQSLLTLSDGL